MQIVESYYMDKIQEHRQKADKHIRQVKKRFGAEVLKVTTRGELEHIFTNALDEVRKNILKRRLRQEILINNRSKNISTVTAYKKS